MKAIVTGATGGLGRNLVAALLARGDEVLALGRNTAIGASLNTTFTACELSDSQAVLAAFESADVVFHCAALSSPWGEAADFQRANVDATRHILQAMAHHHIEKIVYVSTSSVYFDFKDRRNVTENFLPKQFVNHYARTKYQTERLILGHPCQSVIIRPRGIFGEHDQVLVPRLLRVAEKGVLPLVKRLGKPAGSALVDVTYVGNVVQALLLCADKPVPSQSIFNISNQEPLTIAEIYRLIADKLQKNFRYQAVPYPVLCAAATAMETTAKAHLTGEPLLTQYALGLISYDQTLNNDKARNILGYRPQFSIAEGLQRYGAHHD
ncbi:MAG: epimerase [Gammaproteobacteria bacterium]|nr:MAG: epimerase [Gammaproteobacteria bacterium]